MPVTAKLSKRFYETFGEDVTNELVNWFNAVDATYRADLRDLNDVNFARFDAKLGERLAELRADLEQRISALRVDMTKLEAQLDKRLDRLKTELLRWLFGFWVSTLLGLGALFFRQ